MAKTSLVLRALGILGLDEIQKLSEAQSEHIQLKRAAGEDLLAWDEPVSRKSVRRELPEGKILEFPKKFISNFSELDDPNKPEPAQDENDSNFMSSDLLLWQREVGKETGGALKKVDAFKGYQKSTQMYVVKTESPEGKSKIRFASTDGILVNKKQS